jgi:DNA-binding winged helix-turn-helix (wHTH) protein/Flp pilus assembly protein TadD
MADRFRLGPWEVDAAGHRLARPGGGGLETVRLEPRVMDLLVALAGRPGEVVSREELLDTVWEGAFVTDEALTTAVYQLRRALGDDARRARFVETVSKGGYRLVAPVEPLATPAPARRAPESADVPAQPGIPARAQGAGGTGWRWAAALAGSLLLAAFGVARWSPRPGSVEILGALPSPTSELPAWLVSPARSAPLPMLPLPPSGTGRQASEALQQGWRLLERTGPDAVAAALDRFERAAALDPRDPRARAGLAEALVRARSYGLREPAEAGERARAAAAAGVALGPKLAATHRALAYVRLAVDWDFAGAELELARALALDPGSARVHSLLAQIHFVAGRREAALASIARARRLAPDSPGIQSLAGTLAAMLERPELAERAYLRALALDPGAEEPVRGLAKLRSAREEALRGAPETEPRAGLDRLASMASEGPVSPSYLAALYAELGDEREAFAWLDRAWRDRDPGLFFLRYDRRWQPYRDHPRVRELLDRLSAS